MDHNEFISQGVLSREIQGSDAAAARRGYEALNRYIVAWLADFVRNGGSMAGPAASAPLSVERAATGSALPTWSAGQPPSARVVRHLFSTGDAQFMPAFAALRSSIDSSSAVGVLTMLLTGAVGRNDTARALGTLRQVQQADPALATAVLARIDDRAKLFERYNIREHAATWRRYHEVLRGGGSP